MKRLVAVAAIGVSGLLGSCADRAEAQYAYAIKYCDLQEQTMLVAGLEGACTPVKEFKTVILHNNLYSLFEADSEAMNACQVYAKHQPLLAGWRISLRTDANEIKASCEFREGD